MVVFSKPNFECEGGSANLIIGGEDLEICLKTAQDKHIRSQNYQFRDVLAYKDSKKIEG